MSGEAGRVIGAPLNYHTEETMSGWDLVCLYLKDPPPDKVYDVYQLCLLSVPSQKMAVSFWIGSPWCLNDHSHGYG